jgi:hypothetical protein
MKRYSSCTIQRTWVEHHHTVNMLTGAATAGESLTVTGPCGIPLFGERAEIGVCSSCASGWSVEGNCFADDLERERAKEAA